MSIFVSDIQGCLVGFVFLQLHISNQSADFRGNGVGQPKSFYMFGKGWTDTFSLVRIIRFKVGSNTSDPTTRMAADHQKLH